jgi:hypothetical protein
VPVRLPGAGVNPWMIEQFAKERRRELASQAEAAAMGQSWRRATKGHTPTHSYNLWTVGRRLWHRRRHRGAAQPAHFHSAHQERSS